MIIGVDLGTSALKALVLDAGSGRVIAQEREPLQVRQVGSEGMEADPESWWSAWVTAVRRLGSRVPGGLERVRAVGVSTIFPALVPMDASGRALRPAILYCDRRSAPQAGRLAAQLGVGRFEERTHNPLTPGTCTLPVLAWLRETEPEVFASAHVFGQASTFLVHRLTGGWTVDHTHASLSGLVEAGREDEWDAGLLGLAGVEAERLPRLLPSAAVAGEVTAAAAAACGLRPGTPVVAGAGDAPLAAVGGGTVREHELFCSAGSTDCLMFTGTRPPRNPAFANVRYPLPGLWVSIGTMSSGGAAVQWFCDRVLGAGPGPLTEWAAAAAPGAGGVVFLPYLQGERTPWWDPRATGCFHGLTLSTRREELCRAVLEGVAFGWRQIVRLLETEYGFRAAEMVVVGGGSTNPLWNRIKASALGIPLRALRFPETSALGAALIAGIGAGIFRDAVAARDATAGLRGAELVEPDPAWAAVYEEQAAVYERLYPALSTLR